MARPNWKNRTLLHGDNLEFLRSMNSESVNLIATDPPFNKGRDFHATPDSMANGASFQDRWSWDVDVHESWVDKLQDDFPKVMNVINGSRESYGDDMGAFLCFMGVRIIEMHRILRETGSMYLHCDPTASHYLKELMDSIFGRDNFRNEIVWKRSMGPKGSNHMPKKFGAMHDVILFYCKDYSAWEFTNPWKPLLQEEIESKFPNVDEMGRRWKDDSAHIWGIPFDAKRPNLCYEWRGFTNPDNKCWRFMKSRLEEEYQKGNFVIIMKNGKRKLQRRMYADTYRGERMDDFWDDILIPLGREKVGYPTQKPLALYERIIGASSSEGDIVLDPFCGCATTCVAAEKLDRQWVGIDIWDKAHKVVIDRLRTEGFLAGPKELRRQDLLITRGEITYTKKPLKRTDGGSEAVPFLETKMKQYDDRERDPHSNQKKKCILLEQNGSCCQGCGIELHERYLELDHKEPRSAGGSNLLRNRILLCGPCNKLKRDLHTIVWLRKENKKLGYMMNEKALVSLK